MKAGRATELSPPNMTALDVAVGAPIGFGLDVRLPAVTTAPLVALEEAVAAAVRRTPCCVAFSGGRDSSLVLAAAVRAAARQGCPQPIAATVRFRGESTSNESAWQDLVLEHLGVTDRVVLEVDDELDLVGPVATRELHRRGALFPANCHALAPLVECASGGSLLVGLGGDELLSGHRWARVNDVLARRQRPGPRDVGRVVLAALPGMLRARMLIRQHELQPPRWLRPTASQRLRRIERTEPDEPVRFDRVVPHAARARTLLVAAESLKRLSGDVTIEAPLLDPRFVAALASAGGARGWGGRAAAMRAIVGDALPDAILGRRDKANFDASYFGAVTRRFAETWTGGGIDISLVDPDALRREWLEPKPDFRSALLLQIAWLHDHGLTPDGLPLRHGRRNES